MAFKIMQADWIENILSGGFSFNVKGKRWDRVYHKANEMINTVKNANIAILISLCSN